MINAEQPDLVLIAGDIIDMSMRPLLEENIAEEFRRLKAPVYACLGNHEYFSRTPLARQFYQDAGIRLLCDSAAVVDSSLVIVGRDDRTNRHRKELETLVKETRRQVDGQVRDPYVILLDHQPYNLEKAEEAGIDFQLSGHTHRGQVWPISWITDAIYECSWGSHQRGDTRYYVSSGIGIWGGKFRIGSQSEYAVARLKTEK
jgi:predicted MPP superfamily phosphohydrolase